MLKLAIAHLPEGHSRLEQCVQPNDVGLTGNEEFRDPIEVVLDIEKVGNDFFVDLASSTQTRLICDRCLEPFTAALAEKSKIILSPDVKLDETDEEEVFAIEENTKEVDITNSVRQALLLGLPFKRLCHDDCKGLCPTCGTNLNKKTCHCRPVVIDSRWDALRKLRKKM